jgi:hypothetical protein
MTMERDPWFADETTQDNADPFDFDMNADELINNDNWLTDPAPAQHLQIEKIERVNSNNKSNLKITFRIIEGDHQDKLVSDYFAGSEAARWRIRELVIACGFYTLVNDDKGRQVKHVNRGATVFSCENKTLIADCVKETSSDGRSFIRIRKMIPE